MASPRDEFDRLLEAPSFIDSELAQQLLAEAGIPTFLHPVDSREAFALSRHPFDAPDLYVPKGELAHARAVLRDAWGDAPPSMSPTHEPLNEESR
jgi:hypothetical protein